MITRQELKPGMDVYAIAAINKPWITKMSISAVTRKEIRGVSVMVDAAGQEISERSVMNVAHWAGSHRYTSLEDAVSAGIQLAEAEVKESERCLADARGWLDNWLAFAEGGEGGGDA